MSGEKIVFLDRDGVINRYPGEGEWVKSPAEFEFLPGALAAIARLTRAGFRIYVISNQAGVERGIFTQAALDEITTGMLAEVERRGGRLAGVYYCIHTRERNCSCRKPKTGSLEQATAGLEIDRGSCYFVGDTATDIETGRNFGCRTLLVFSGKEKPQNEPQWTLRPDATAASLAEAVDIIMSGE